MLDILIPAPDADRRQAAHLVDDGRDVSLCGMHAWQTGEACVPDTPEQRQCVKEAQRHVCGLCLDILRRHTNAAETVRREAERRASAPPKPPTKRQLEAERLARWNENVKAAWQT